MPDPVINLGGLQCILIPAAQQANWAELHPPKDSAPADAAAWITGVILDIAGGAVMT